MNNSTKDQIGCDVICKSHSARTERDLYRICPSKLSKRELEDLYFALLENNLELKKTINVQQDKIKVLSTRLQRMTVVQKNGAGKEKDCCASKAVVSEQKESLTDLKKTNERMAERIRLLNMRLCSAKQFLKRSSLQSNTSNKICTRCSFKNSSMSALNAKRSDSNIRTTAVSCQSLDNNIIEKPTRTVETETEIPEKENLEPCNENKCRTMMDELKEKIVNLQEELAISHNEYSERMAKLESQVSQLNYENVRARSECVASEHALQERVKKADLLQDKLRNADAKCNELNMELSIEKRKVTELETGLKLANMSKHVLDTIDQFTAEKNDDDDDDKQEQAMSELCRNRSCCSEVSQKERVCSPTESAIGLVVATPSAEPKAAQLELPSTSIGDEIKISVSEDSGYTELNKSCETEADQAMVKMNRELLQKIADLQTQLDMLRISTAGETKSKQSKKPSNSESYDVEIKDINEKQPLNVDEPSTMVNLIIEERNSDAPQAELEGDKDTSPENEERPSTSEPWEDYLIAGGNANVDHSDSDNMEQPVESSTVKHKSEMRVIRDDEHNSFQIPGPMPVASSAQSFSKDKKKSFKNSLTSKDSYNERLRKKKANSEEKTVKIFEDSQDSYFNSEKQNGSATKVGKPMDPTLVANLKEYVRDMEAERRTKDMAEKKQKSVSITDVEAKLADRTPTRDSIFVNRRKLASNSDNETMAEVKKESMTSFYLDSVCTPPQASAKSLQRRELAQDEENVKNVDNFGTEMDPPPIPNRRDSATYTADAANTYTVEVEKRSRATSPENTEHEISSLTDLPSEKDAKSPRAVLSPGEEKATMTYTDTETETMPADYGSLSEGEMPGGRKDRKLSFGETPAALARISIPATTSSERMQATLQSISEELARCRQLLLNQRPEETDYPQCPRAPATEELAVHALRHSAANRSIAATHTPSCAFILHIGTLVLSDESVLFTRDKALVLMWKFYSQNAAMTRVQPGRVVQFDFVTEYDVSFDEDFLDYMKHSNLAIILCEVGKHDEPFAMCSLPLREALLHANRRADMSLALIPSSPADRANGSDEIGVLDLWCSLRVDTSLLPTIHKAMHTPPYSTPNWNHINPLRNESQAPPRPRRPRRRSTDMEVNGERFSTDLDLNKVTQSQLSAEEASSNFNPTTDDDYQARLVRDPSSRYEDEVLQYRSSRPYRRSSQALKSNPNSELCHRGQVEFDCDWATPASITSGEDMKKALDRNVQQDNVTRLPKMDDDAPHIIHSSIGSVKSLAARHQLSKLRWSKNKTSREHVDSLQDLLKKEKGSSVASTERPTCSMEGYVKEDSSGTLSKLNNINKYIGVPGLTKLVEASKKSVKYTDPPREEPQKETSADSDENNAQSIDITILWLALNEECEAMVNPRIQRLYVAYSFLGRRGADLETPFSLPKPKHYADKCYFNFKKTFHLHECDLPLLGHMSRCRAGGGASTDPRDCIVFTLVSEPPEDPLGLSSCEDVGYAYLYLGDVLAYSGGSGGYTEVLGVRGVRSGVCGVLAVRVDQLPVLRRCLSLSHSRREVSDDPSPTSLPPMFEIE